MSEASSSAARPRMQRNAGAHPPAVPCATGSAAQGLPVRHREEARSGRPLPCRRCGGTIAPTLPATSTAFDDVGGETEPARTLPRPTLARDRRKKSLEIG